MRFFNGRYLPLSVCAVAFCIWSFLLFYKYVHFGYNDRDLAFFTQACWQLLHGSQFTSVTGINYFGDHSFFITLLILPFFALAPHPVTLLVLKLIAYLAAAYLFYKIAYESSGQRTALALMILYIIFPANIFSVLYDFNPESLAPPILFWMFMAFQKQQWRSFLVASVLLILIKENMTLVLCSFGLYGLFRKDCPPKTAWTSLFLGAVTFYILVIHVIPYFRHLAYHPYIVRYSYLGHSVGEIIFNLFTQPQKIINVIFTDMNARYIKALFGPLLLPALFNWPVLFLISPVLLQHLLSTNPEEHSIYYYYGSTVAPFIFLAVMRTLNLCSQRFNRKIFNVILFLLIFCSIAFTFCFLRPFVYKLDYHHDKLEAIRWEFVNSVPSQTGVVATFDYLTPLSLRQYLYPFHNIYNESYQNPQEIKINELNTGKPFILPDQVRYALIDFKDPWLRQSLKLWPRETSQRIQVFFNRGHWKVIKSYGSIVFLKR
jgi:uncharacterized membrane protein